MYGFIFEFFFFSFSSLVCVACVCLHSGMLEWPENAVSPGSLAPTSVYIQLPAWQANSDQMRTSASLPHYTVTYRVKMADGIWSNWQRRLQPVSVLASHFHLRHLRPDSQYQVEVQLGDQRSATLSFGTPAKGRQTLCG